MATTALPGRRPWDSGRREASPFAHVDFTLVSEDERIVIMVPLEIKE